MVPVRSDNPDVLVFRQPGRWSWLFTIPFFLAAAWFFNLVAFGSFGMVRTGLRDGGWLSVLAIVFTLIMFFKLMAFFPKSIVRIGCRVHKRQRLLVREWGIFVLPWHETTVHASGQILVIHGIVRRWSSGRAEHECYLDLRGGDGRSLRIGKAESQQEIVRMAIEVADAAGLEVYDGTSDPAKLLHSGVSAMARNLLAQIQQENDASLSQSRLVA